MIDILITHTSRLDHYPVFLEKNRQINGKIFGVRPGVRSFVCQILSVVFRQRRQSPHRKQDSHRQSTPYIPCAPVGEALQARPFPETTQGRRLTRRSGLSTPTPPEANYRQRK